MPVAYSLFAVTLGVLAGTLIRRTLPAMAVTVAGFLAVRMPVEFLLRPHFMTPVTAVKSPDAAPSRSVAARPGARRQSRTSGVYIAGVPALRTVADQRPQACGRLPGTVRHPRERGLSAGGSLLALSTDGGRHLRGALGGMSRGRARVDSPPSDLSRGTPNWLRDRRSGA